MPAPIYPGYQNVWEYYWNHINLFPISTTKRNGEYVALYTGDGKEDFWKDQFRNAARALFKKSDPDSLTLSDKEVVSDSADARFFRWMQYEAYNGGMEGKVAQTRIMASYGILQLVYYYCSSEVYPKDTDHRPEDLNDHSVGFGAGVSHFRGVFDDRHMLDKHFTDSTWPDGLEKTYFAALTLYNHSKSYRTDVVNRVRTYMPVR
jgi:hypothetical protein